jgi:hypothetical protein
MKTLRYRKKLSCFTRRVADPDPHHFGKLDPDSDPLLSGKLDPDPHQSEKLDPIRIKVKRWKPYKVIWEYLRVQI